MRLVGVVEFLENGGKGVERPVMIECCQIGLKVIEVDLLFGFEDITIICCIPYEQCFKGKATNGVGNTGLFLIKANPQVVLSDFERMSQINSTALRIKGLEK